MVDIPSPVQYTGIRPTDSDAHAAPPADPFSDRPRPYTVWRTEVLYGDVDMSKTVYYLKFIEWCNVAREVFLLKEFIEDVDTYLLAVVEYNQRFFTHAFLGDRILIQLSVGELNKTNFLVLFDVFRERPDRLELLCVQKQRIAYLDRGGRLVRIPERTRQKLAVHLRAPARPAPEAGAARTSGVP
jgi:acyl-CoA thioesterase FadM